MLESVCTKVPHITRQPYHTEQLQLKWLKKVNASKDQTFEIQMSADKAGQPQNTRGLFFNLYLTSFETKRAFSVCKLRTESGTMQRNKAVCVFRSGSEDGWRRAVYAAWPLHKNKTDEIHQMHPLLSSLPVYKQWIIKRSLVLIISLCVLLKLKDKINKMQQRSFCTIMIPTTLFSIHNITDYSCVSFFSLWFLLALPSFGYFVDSVQKKKKTGSWRACGPLLGMMTYIESCCFSEPLVRDEAWIHSHKPWAALIATNCWSPITWAER